MSSDLAPSSADPTSPAEPAPVPRGLVTSASYSITVRLTADGDPASIGRIATAVGSAGGAVTAIDVVDSRSGGLTVDVTCSAADAAHSEEMVEALRNVEGVTVRKVSDRTFLLHLGGKLEIASKVPLKTRDDLSMAYTPGVARVCLALAEHPEDVRRLTIKGNTVAVVTDGSAVLGLGDIGPGASMPVMEGKAALFKRFADIDAWPICLASQDTDEIVKAVEMIAPGFGGINLEDIAAPRCFEIEARLRASLDIPVFHDDQHGTAIVVMAALTNALRVVDKKIADVPHSKASLAARTNPRKVRGDLRDGLRGADVFVGVSAPNVLDPLWIQDMAPDAVVFALANPDPEVDPAEADKYAAVVASGRSDYPNQINNVLAFPGVFRGLLDARAKEITLDMLLRAADAIAHVVTDDEINPNFIIPSVFNPAVPKAVAAAIRGRSTERVADSTA
jgi:malate dehydrogenase (oxaloacetate-decarboxylating)